MQLASIRSALTTPIESTLRCNEYQHAAVMIVIYDQEPTIIMTEKSRNLKHHAGEISFPGGKMEKDDPDLLHTALRETSEEIGVTLEVDQVVGQLKPVITNNSGFVILPFVSVIDDVHSLRANSEVEQIFHISLDGLLRNATNNSANIDRSIMYSDFIYNEKKIWGASARMINQIRYKLEMM